MRKYMLLCITLFVCIATIRGEKKFDFKFYGHVRGDLFINTRANLESFEGVFQLYPLDIALDENGKDLNARTNNGFYMMTTRLGLHMKGPTILGAKSFANIECDFSGFSGSPTLIRLRQANIRLEWEKGSRLLFGQTWHPFFGEVIPNIMNVSTGAPFQPFSRTPQIRYTYKRGDFSISGAALFQYQYMSQGPDATGESVKSLKYSKYAVIPEFTLTADYRNEHLLLVAGAELLTIKPRTESVINDKVYKIDESITTSAFMVAGSYKKGLWNVGAKSVYGQNLSHLTMNGGYAVHSINAETGKYTYTPFQTITSWLNVTYGKKYQGGIYLGHSKNLGTKETIVDDKKIFGQGLDIDTHLYGAAQISYNIPCLTVGFEYALNSAYYGKTVSNYGKIGDTYDVINHRFLLMVCYMF